MNEKFEDLAKWDHIEQSGSQCITPEKLKANMVPLPLPCFSRQKKATEEALLFTTEGHKVFHTVHRFVECTATLAESTCDESFQPAKNS